MYYLYNIILSFSIELIKILLKTLINKNINNIYYNSVIGSGYTPKIEHFHLQISAKPIFTLQLFPSCRVASNMIINFIACSRWISTNVLQKIVKIKKEYICTPIVFGVIIALSINY